ncbi:sensor histidine kinase [Paenibacillaceae bacterium WGS1546]|uniref:sensor histidine kinase n=1 Tax=Cohnella sp. WGS1546 TaxID=3366810 RepID=UPI00372D1209
MSRRASFLMLNVIWWLILCIACTVFAVSKWNGYETLQTPCEQTMHCESPMRLTADAADDLAFYGISTSLYSALLTIFMSIANLAYFAIAALLYRYGRRDPICLGASLFLMITGTIFCTDAASLGESPLSLSLFLGLDAIGSFYLPFLYLFPDGRFAPRWTIIPSAAWVAAQSYRFIFPDQWEHLNWNPAFMTVLLLATHGPFLYSLRYRMNRAETPKERRHLRWFGLSLLAYVAAGALQVLPYLLQDGLVQLAVQVVFYAGLLFWPIAIGIGVLEHRQRHASLVLRRTIIYMIMSFLTILLYAFTVSGFTLILRKDDVLVSLLSCGVVAILFHPIHIRLQRGVNRLVFGDPANPYDPLARLLAQMEAIGRKRSIWADVVQGTAQALSFPYAALFVGNASEEKAAEYGNAPRTVTRIPLSWEGEKVGSLALPGRESLDRLSRENAELLRLLISQISFALHSARLAEQLKESKERLVYAREEERRRLRRDLHDGLGAQLASVLLKSDVIADLAEKDASLHRQIAGIQEGIEEAIKDIRTLVYALRPPVLDEFGLPFALKELAARFSAGGKEVQLALPESLALDEVIELAVYRIVQEALTNSFRHGEAARCRVELSVREGRSLHLVIADDGTGFKVDAAQSGVGIRSMKERAGELGGSCEWVSTKEGTTVNVMIPIGRRDAAIGKHGT